MKFFIEVEHPITDDNIYKAISIIAKRRCFNEYDKLLRLMDAHISKCVT